MGGESDACLLKTAVLSSLKYIVYIGAETELHRERYILLCAQHICFRSVSFPLQLRDILFTKLKAIVSISFRLLLFFLVFDASVESVRSLEIAVYIFIL